MFVPKFLLCKEASLKLLLDEVTSPGPNIAAMSHRQLLRQLASREMLQNKIYNPKH